MLLTGQILGAFAFVSCTPSFLVGAAAVPTRKHGRETGVRGARSSGGSSSNSGNRMLKGSKKSNTAVSCSGNELSGIVDSDVVISIDATCSLYDVTINGNIWLQDGSSLLAYDGTTILGSVIANDIDSPSGSIDLGIDGAVSIDNVIVKDSTLLTASIGPGSSVMNDIIIEDSTLSEPINLASELQNTDTLEVGGKIKIKKSILSNSLLFGNIQVNGEGITIHSVESTGWIAFYDVIIPNGSVEIEKSTFTLLDFDYDSEIGEDFIVKDSHFTGGTRPYVPVTRSVNSGPRSWIVGGKLLFEDNIMDEDAFLRTFSPSSSFGEVKFKGNNALKELEVSALVVADKDMKIEGNTVGNSLTVSNNQILEEDGKLVVKDNTYGDTLTISGNTANEIVTDDNTLG